MDYKIIDQQVVFDDHYKMIKAKVEYNSFDGEKIKTERLAFERGNSAAILLYEKDSHTILLTKQFRYPTCKNGDGWILEIPAGSIDKNESPEECIIRETMEELGYRINSPQKIKECYTSPGGSTEMVYIFYAAVSAKDRTGKGGGNKNEKEDIKSVHISLSELDSKLDEIIDAKTIIALQWFLLKNEIP